jgi:molybdate transport system substrate-binding protein
LLVFAGVPTVARRHHATLLVMAILVAACSSDGAAVSSGALSTALPSSTAPSHSPPSTSAASLTIYGAASLKGVLERAKSAWEAANAGSVLTIATDSSSALEMQIEQGAPADVFLSADTTNPGKLIDHGLAAGAAVTFAGNELTIVVPAANPAGITSPLDLARAGIKVIAAGDQVPITKYATQLVANLAQEAGAPADFAARYAANVVSREDNVKAIVAKMELGEGDAGIVYVTDAAASTKVQTIRVPDSANVPATYAGVVVKASQHAATAQAFLHWLAGAGGQKILAGFGFLPPP